MATKFTKDNLHYFGGYLTVQHNGKQEFVARFKYGRGRGRFVSFLKKHFTVEEYLALRETVNPKSCVGNKYAPSEILQLKGWDPISPEVRAQVAAYEARRVAAGQPL